MKIKKVDDKPMVIHTKKKAKLHTHEPKKASIKAANIYTVDRSPKIKGSDSMYGFKVYAISNTPFFSNSGNVA